MLNLLTKAGEVDKLEGLEDRVEWVDDRVDEVNDTLDPVEDNLEIIFHIKRYNMKNFFKNRLSI